MDARAGVQLFSFYPGFSASLFDAIPIVLKRGSA